MPICPAARAIKKAGGIAVSINPMNKERELAQLLTDSGATVLVTLQSLYRDVAGKSAWLFLWTTTLSFVRDRPLGWEHFSRRNFHLQRPAEKLEQHSDPFSCRQQLGDEHLESPKRSFYELNWLANFGGGIDSDDFFGASL